MTDSLSKKTKSNVKCCHFVWVIYWSYYRAAEKGNFEAAVKLGIAYLYNEGRKFSSLIVVCCL